MAEGIDPSILMIRDEMNALKSLIKNQTTTNVSDGLTDIIRKLPQLQNDYINAMKNMDDANKNFTTSLSDVSKNFTGKISEMESALKSQEEQAKRSMDSLSKITTMNAAQMQDYDKLLSETVGKTGDELAVAQLKLKGFLDAVYQQNTKDFEQFREQYTAGIKDIITENFKAGKSVQEYGEETAKEITRITGKTGEQKLTASELTQVMSQLKINQDIVGESQGKLSEAFEKGSIAALNQHAKVTVLREELDKLKASIDQVNKNVKIQEGGFNDMGAAFSKYADVIGKEQKTLFGGLIKSTLDFRKESHSVGDFFKSFGASLTDAKNGLLSYDKMIDRVFGFMQQRMISPTFEFAKAIAQVNKETGGFGKEFQSSTMESFAGMQASTVGALGMYGVSLEKYGKAYGELANKIGGFNDMSDKQRKILAANAAALETLGISTDTYAKLTTGFMGALQKNTLATRDAIEGLAKDAVALGKNVGQYTREFEQFMPKLIGYGREASTIFKEVSAFAQATKGALQSSDIMALSERFQTFESAAESVSKLNAMLGGVSVNILDVMGKDPAQIAMTVKRAANEANLEFDKLNIGYKRMLSEAFGGDMQKAAAFYKMDLAEAQEYMDRASATEKELEERKRASVAAQEKLNALMDNFKIGLTPILDMFNGMASVFTWMSQNGKVLIGGVLLTMTGLIMGAVYAWNQFKAAAVSATNQVIVAMENMRRGVVANEAEVARLIQQYRQLSMAASSYNKTNFSPKGVANFAGGGKAMGAAIVAMGAISLLGMAGKGISETAATGPQDHMEAGIVGPSGKISQTAGENFVYRNGTVTTFNKNDIIGAAKPGEQVFLQPSVSNISNTSNTISNGYSNRTDYLSQMTQEMPIVRSLDKMSASLVTTSSQTAKSIEVSKESLKMQSATKELRESADLRKESEVQRQKEVFEKAFTSEKVRSTLMQQPQINNIFKVGRKEMKLFTEEASGPMTEAVAYNFNSRGPTKG
jgi:hypothetical protein